MTDTAPIDVPDVPTNLSIALGAVEDAAGDVLVGDTFDAGSVVFTVSDTTLAVIDSQDPNAGTAQVSTQGHAGSFTIGVTCTVGGVAVTGTSPAIDVVDGPPATIQVDVTVG